MSGRRLVGQDATSKRAFDNAAANKQEADAEVKSAEANLALARQNLSYTKIYSPFDGQIGLNTYSVGNLVDQNSGTLATVVKVDPVRVEFVITEFELIKLLKLRKGAEAPKVRVRLFLQDGSEYSEPGRLPTGATGSTRIRVLSSFRRCSRIRSVSSWPACSCGSTSGRPIRTSRF